MSAELVTMDGAIQYRYGAMEAEGKPSVGGAKLVIKDCTFENSMASPPGCWTPCRSCPGAGSRMAGKSSRRPAMVAVCGPSFDGQGVEDQAGRVRAKARARALAEKAEVRPGAWLPPGEVSGQPSLTGVASG